MILDKFYDKDIWALKYRPRKIEDLITTESIKTQLNSICETGKLSNSLFYGSAGTGKTTAAAILADSLGRETLYINGSIETGIDVLRNKISSFVTSLSLDGGKRIVIIDECDRAGGNLQDAFKSFLEEFSKACNFIFISNHKNKIIPELQSRLQTINFNCQQEEINTLKKNFFVRTIAILDDEKVDYDKKVVAHVVNNLFPDMRKILTELEKFAQQNMLNNMQMIKALDADILKFFSLLSNRNFSGLKKYIVTITDPQRFYSSLNEVAADFIDVDSILTFCIFLSDYSYKSAFMIDPQVNLTGFISSCLGAGVKVKENV